MSQFVPTAAFGASLAAVALFAIGCGQNTKTGEGAPAATETAHNDGDGHDHKEGEHKEGHTHGEWWCGEHGVPEEICAQCSSKVAADFQKKGDWCEKHDRPDSQCFVCHPEHKVKFAAQYKAKYGKEPPPLEEEEKKEPGKS